MTVIFRDVKEDAQALAEMLRLAPGNRKVPVLVEGEELSIGFRGA